METWQDTEVRGLPRIVSDNYALVLSTKNIYWGLKFFRFLNAWKSNLGFREVVEESWREEVIHVWESYVFKQKLKRFKGVLKEWNMDQFGNIDQKNSEARKILHELDMQDKVCGLSGGEAISRSDA